MIAQGSLVSTRRTEIPFPVRTVILPATATTEIPDTPVNLIVNGNFSGIDTDGDGGVRACVSIEGLDWWKTEFMAFDGELKYRATGGDQDRVNGKKGEVLSINFLKGTGSIK